MMDGFTFWREQLNSPKYIVAPMVDASELAWRVLSRRFGAQLCYTPMLHASVFVRDAHFRRAALASCEVDRPLIVQFCGNDPEVVFRACQLAEDHCDAIDLNLGCPQGIAKKGNYGAFLQDEWELIERIVKRCSNDLKVPFTAKIRVFPELEKTINYAKMLEAAGCKMLTVHGRTREQKGPLTGLADWSYVTEIKKSLRIPVFSNGNIQYLDDVHRCLDETGVDGVMIAEGSLYNPALFKGIQPVAWDIALEYLDLVDQYPCPLSYVRGHLFKIFQHPLTVHSHLRPQLASARNVTEMREVIQLIKGASKEDVAKGIAGYNGDLPYPYWFCQPYVRPSPEESARSKPEKVEIRANDLEGVKRSLSETSLDLDWQPLSKNKLKKLKKNPKKKFGAAQSQEKYEKCASCVKPKGQKCVFDLCKACCKTRVYLEEKSCPGHKLKAKSQSADENSQQNMDQSKETTACDVSTCSVTKSDQSDCTSGDKTGCMVQESNTVSESTVVEIKDAIELDTASRVIVIMC